MTKEGLLVDVPESVKKKAHREIWNYTIGFVRLGKTNNHETAELLGSGILVSAKNQKVILTAQHVLEILPKKGRLGLILTVKEEKPTIDVKGLHYVKIDRGKIDTNGPDLGFVRLSVSPASTLGAVKSFYNLDKHRERLLDNPPCDHAGIWGAQGFIEQLTSTKIRNTPKTLVKGFYQYAAFGGISDYEIRGKYDYFRFPIVDKNGGDEPNDYGGISGGGIWQIVLALNEHDEIKAEELLLRGFVYFQETINEKGDSSLKCHAQKSIYEHAYKKIISFSQ